jgi:hypothetical protein
VAYDKLLINTDFGAPSVKLREIKSEKVNGSLAEPWQDESNWAPLRANYQSLSTGGESFQRLTVSRLESGRAQIVHPLPALAPDAMYVLEMKLRGAPAATGVPQTPFTVGIRQRDAPYEFIWQDKVLPAREWQDITFTFSPKKSDLPVGFYIMTDSNGTVDIDRVRLWATTREDYVKTLGSPLFPAAGRATCCRRHASLLAYLPGWQLNTAWGDDRDDAAEPVISSDAKVVGPSGSPSLHVQGQRSLFSTARRFQIVLPHRKHVTSVAMRGTGNGSWGIYVGDKEIARQEINLNNAEWKRHELEFTPDLAAKTHTLRFQSEGGFDLWLDALQVTSDQLPREYSMQMLAEVALSTGSTTNIHFSDEPAQINYTVSGKAAGATLNYRVVSLAGDETTPAAIGIKAGAAQSGSLNYALFPKRPLGVYRVEAWLEDGNGKQISPLQRSGRQSFAATPLLDERRAALTFWRAHGVRHTLHYDGQGDGHQLDAIARCRRLLHRLGFCRN